MDIGLFVTQLVLGAATILVNPAAPGYVVMGLVLIFAITAVLYWRRVTRQTAAMAWLTEIVSEPKDAIDFTAKINDLSERINEGKEDPSRQHLVSAWKEYRETLLVHGSGPNEVLRNSVRPSTFLNLEDLQMGPDFWRIVPGLFVSAGLFLTFLGLVAALSQTEQLLNTATGDAQEGLKDLLKTASAKFIMSLTGLACSILFTMHLRAGLGKIEKAIHRLCNNLEIRLSYISLEEVALEQLKASQEHGGVFKTMLAELTADLNRELRQVSGPLKNEIPEIIASAITTSLEPVIKKVAEMGTSGVGEMVGDLSNRLSADIGSALSDAANKITAAGSALSDIAGKMDGSSNTLNEKLNTTISNLALTIEGISKTSQESAASTQQVLSDGVNNLLSKMNETLVDIKENTGAGAAAVKEAADVMRKAAEAFKTELANASEAGGEIAKEEMGRAGKAAGMAITEAGNGLLSSFGDTAKDIAAMSKSMTEKLQEGLLEPLGAISGRLGDMNKELGSGTTEIRRLNEGIKLGAEQTANAATSFRTASDAFQKAASPVIAATERNEAIVTKLQSSVFSLERMMANGLEAAEKGLDAINSTIDSVETITDKFALQAARLDDMDGKLGQAFERYANNVESALGLLKNHVSEMQAKVTPAIDRMREVVAHAETFIPSNRQSGSENNR
jgi:methyl-accepting chemotaxis protein